MKTLICLSGLLLATTSATAETTDLEILTGLTDTQSAQYIVQERTECENRGSVGYQIESCKTPGAEIRFAEGFGPIVIDKESLIVSNNRGVVMQERIASGYLELHGRKVVVSLVLKTFKGKKQPGQLSINQKQVYTVID